MSEENGINPLDHLNLIRPIAARYYNAYRNKGVEYDDLYQEGWFGLKRAAELWIPKEGGLAFSTYAWDWIEMRVRRASRYTRGIYIPETALLGREDRGQPKVTPPVMDSIHRKLGTEEDDSSVGDIIPLEESPLADRVEAKLLVQQLLSMVSAGSRSLLEAYYNIDPDGKPNGAPKVPGESSRPAGYTQAMRELKAAYEKLMRNT